MTKSVLHELATMAATKTTTTTTTTTMTTTITITICIHHIIMIENFIHPTIDFY